MASRVQVKVESGVLEGLTCENNDDSGKKYFSFQGIPYAKPPVGELRFKAPQPVEPWTGVKEATEDGERCYSTSYEEMLAVARGSEDCLTLNVYTPKLPIETNGQTEYDLKPVMVFIHGGGFDMGSSTKKQYGPQYLLREDVVFVSTNYRTGLLGFLSLKDTSLEVPGNAGFKDMVLALKWVQANIKNFNGDPNNVTIFGESAGAASVHLLMLSPLAKGLFHKVIAQSGCGLNPWALCLHAPPYLASELEIDANDEVKLLQTLQNLSVEEFFALQQKVCKRDLKRQRPYGLTIENPNQNGEAFLTENPWKIVERGDYQPLPLLMGFNSREGIMMYFIEKYRKIDPEEVERFVPPALGLKKGSFLSKQVGQKVWDFYFEGQNPEDADIDKTFKIISDHLFIRDVYLCALLHSKKQVDSVYLYEMTLETPINYLKKMFKITTPGVCHADDLAYLFNMADLKIEIEPNSPADIGIRRFCRLWANFAKYGNPNSQDKDPLVPVVWKPFTEDKQCYLEIGENLSLKMKPAHDRMEFWEEIFRYRNINQS